MTSNIAPSAYTPQNYRHLQDLVAQTNNLKHTDKASTKSWIQTAQTHWNQSKMAKEIGALDKAYEEFLMALEIIVNMIPACHDWPTISMSKTPVKQQYEALRMNLKNNTTEYDKIKQIIKQDNKLSGILATAEHLKNKDMINQSNSAVYASRKHLNTQENYPNSLRSTDSSISPGSTKSKSTPSILSSGSQTVVTLDKDSHTRISELPTGLSSGLHILVSGSASQPSSVTTRSQKGPHGPRVMPPPLVVKDVFPRLPAPTYSPATSYSSSGGLPPLRNSTRAFMPPKEDFNQQDSEDRGIPLPTKQSISSEELFGYLKHPSTSVLLLDVRPRDDFVQGHIFASSIVCFEPIAIRDEMSEDDLEQSLVLIESREPQIFSTRHEFDLVVYFDESTKDTVSAMKIPHMRNLYYALYDYANSKKTKLPPILLEGGMASWIDYFGTQSLKQENPIQYSQSVESINTDRTQNSSEARKSQRPLVADVNPSDAACRRSYPLAPDHVPVETKTVKSLCLTDRDEKIAMTEPNVYDDKKLSMSLHKPPGHAQIIPSSGHPTKYPRSVGAYFKQYPPFSHEPQNMSSSQVVGRQTLQHQTIIDHPFNLFSDVRNPVFHSPSSPVRPAPVAPRKSYSGVSERPVSSTSYPISIARTRPSPMGIPKFNSSMVGSANTSFGTTGLKNLGNTCYMNSILQCMSGTIPLSRYFLDGSYKSHLNPDNPRGSRGVLTNAFADVIRNLWSGEYKFTSPVMFKDVFGRIYKRFNAATQQDSHEFFVELLSQLHEDLNSNANRTKLNNLTEDEERRRDKMPVQIASLLEWERYTHQNFSVIVNWMQGLQVCRRRCLTCSATTSTYEVFMHLTVSIPKTSRTCSLQDLLRDYTKEEPLEGWNCPHCKQPRKATIQITITRLPHILVIHLKRFHNDGRWLSKLDTFVKFPLSNLDLTEFIPSPLNGEKQQAIETLPPFIYDLYGISNHYGNGLQSGHYVAFVKNHYKRVWTKFDDTQATIMQESSVVSHHAYVLFWARQHVM